MIRFLPGLFLVHIALPTFAEDIEATNRRDVVVIDPDRGVVSVNGVNQPFPSDAVVRIFGLNGNDRVVYRGSPDLFERGRMVNNALVIDLPGQQIVAGGFESCEMRGNGDDTLEMTGSDRADKLRITDTWAELRSGKRRLIGQGLRRLEVTAVAGGIDRVDVTNTALDKLVSTETEVTMLATEGPTFQVFLTNFDQIDTEAVDHFVLNDTAGDDTLLLGGRRVRWLTDDLEIDQVGDYSKIVAESGRFGRTGQDRVHFRMKREGETSVSLDDTAGFDRDLVLRYLSGLKSITTINFEDMDVDILSGDPSGECRLRMHETEALMELRVDGGRKETALALNLPFQATLDTSGFDYARFDGIDCQWTGSPGTDRITSTGSVDSNGRVTHDYQLASGGTPSDPEFVYEQTIEHRRVKLRDVFLRADGNGGSDRVDFLHVGGEIVLDGETVRRPGFLGANLDDTVTTYVGPNTSSAAIIETSSTTGLVRVNASPDSTLFSGRGYRHRVTNFPHVGVGFDRFATAGAIRDFGPGEVEASYNPMNTPLEFVKNGRRNYTRFNSPLFLTATVAGSQFITQQSTVLFYKRNFVFESFDQVYTDGLTANGLDTIQFTPPSDYTETCEDPLVVPDPW